MAKPLGRGHGGTFVDKQPMEFQSRDAEVIDITPLSCPRCQRTVELADAYCDSCGTSLLEIQPHLCGNCGRGLGDESTFCPGCGARADTGLSESTVTIPPAREGPTLDDPPTVTAPAVTTPTIVPPDTTVIAPTDDLEPQPERNRKKLLAWTGATFFLLAALGATWFFFLRAPDLTIYDSELKNASAVSEDVQDALGEITDPASLPAFAASVSAAREQFGEIQKDVQALANETHREALLEVVDTGEGLLAEMERLATLPSGAIDESEFSSLPELLNDYETAYAAAQRLRSVEGTPAEMDLELHVLERTLYDLSAYRKEVIADRARITRENKERTVRLATAKAFIGDFDGIIARYSDSRTELSEWITGTNAGATFYEAYQTLDQQQARRVELREELSALESPAQFSRSKSELLGIMDTAIDAMGAASRGMAEYEYTWSYWDFRDTPGWQQFESATSDITRRLSATLADYESTKSSVVRKLRKKTALPPLPD